MHGCYNIVDNKINLYFFTIFLFLYSPRIEQDAAARHPRQAGLGLRRDGVQTAQSAYETETESPLFPGTSLRTGEALQAAALPIGAGARPTGPDAEADPSTGENMVPESPLQTEAPKPGQDTRACDHARPQASRGARASTRREALSHGPSGGSTEL